MEKLAQKRGPLTKLRELVNIPGERIEELMGGYSPQFTELMEQLREVDDRIREQASELKNLLKLAKTNFNRREYIVATALLGQFHQHLENIYNEFAKLSTTVDVKHHEFLFGDVDPDQIQFLTKELGPKFKDRKTKLPMAKAAGISDWWHNALSDRGKAMAAWEKRFPKEAKAIKKGVASMLTKSESLLANLLGILKVLGKYRATRSLEEYLHLADKFNARYKQYDESFVSFYNTYVSRFVEMQRESMEKAMNDSGGGNPGGMPMGTPGTSESPPPSDKQPFKGIVHFPSALDQKEPVQHPTGNPFQAILDAKEKREQAQTQKMPQMPRKFPVAPLTERHSELPFSPTERSPSTDEDQEFSVHESDIIPPDTEREPDTKPETAPHTVPEVEKTLVSPTFRTPKEKPIMVANHTEFMKKIAQLSSESSFAVAAELILYADQIKDIDSETSQKLTQLSQKLLGK